MEFPSPKKSGLSDFAKRMAKTVFSPARNLFRRIAGKIKAFRDIKGREDPTLSNYDKELVLSLSKSKFPSLRQFTYLGKFLSSGELSILRLAVFLLIVCLIFSGTRFYQKHIEISPVEGGEYIEGLIGSPNYINPLYKSINDVDSDIGSLIFSALFKRDSSGNLTNDLAVNTEVSPDGKNYTFEIRGDAVWHNNNPVTADDVVFTFNAIRDGAYKSPLKNVFAGVSMEKTADNKITFHLTEPYAGFLDLLTFGIISRNIWEEIPADSAPLAELNLKPVGSGPYKFKSFSKDKNGKVKSYSISLYENYYGAKPYIKDITFIFFPAVEEAAAALNDNSISGIGYLPASAKSKLIAQDSLNFHKLSIPRITAVFFNSGKNPVLAEKKARQALAYAINADGLINELGAEYYIRNYGPLPNGNYAQKADNRKYDYNRDEALKLFKELGWEPSVVDQAALAGAQLAIDGDSSADEKKRAQTVIELGEGSWLKKGDIYLTVKLTSVDRPENQLVAEMIRKDWEAIGVKTRLELVSVAQIQGNILKARDFEALFYGLTLGADPDPYSFWHSSQIEKGLNLSGFSNKDSDKILEEARQSTDKGKRVELYHKFQEILAEESPAVFLYQNTYIYVQSKHIKGYGTSVIYSPSDRFSDIANWYLKTGKSFKW